MTLPPILNRSRRRGRKRGHSEYRQMSQDRNRRPTIVDNRYVPIFPACHRWASASLYESAANHCWAGWSNFWPGQPPPSQRRMSQKENGKVIDQSPKVGSVVLALDPSRGSGVYPVFASVDLQVGTATGRQALVVAHGRLRNASDYFKTGQELANKGGAGSGSTIVVAPQLLDQADVDANGLADRYLRWNGDWEGGMPAQGPSPASSYDVLDDVVAKLSNTSAFPQLKRLVFIGHGGGANARPVCRRDAVAVQCCDQLCARQSGIVSVSHRDAAVSDRTGLPRSALPRILR